MTFQTQAEKVNKFSDLKLGRTFQENLHQLGFTTPTEIQKLSIPPALQGQDIRGIAETGSGKTLAFGIALLQSPKTAQGKHQSLVITPTRELADQVAKTLRQLARSYPGYKVLTLTGGDPIPQQMRSLERGWNIIVGTPGRLLFHLRKKSLSLSKVQGLVLDEGDRMLDMGFQDDIDMIVSELPEQKQTLIFSATFPEELVQLAEQYQNDATVCEQASAGTKPKALSEFILNCQGRDKAEALSKLIQINKLEQGIIFVRTKADTQLLSEALRSLGVKSRCLHGDLPQWQRREHLTIFKNGTVSWLIATDLAARGIDIADLPCVINYHPAGCREQHVHRMGRTARQNQKGAAIHLADDWEFKRLTDYDQSLSDKHKLLAHDTLPTKFQGKDRMPTCTLKIHSGKAQKIRPTDIVGTFTKGLNIPFSEIGQIEIERDHSYVAVPKSKGRSALQALRKRALKGQVRVVKLLEA